MKNKLKMALVGKSIHHSLSPEIYKNLLKAEVEYSLLNFDSTDSIPPLKELSKKFDILNITSPYKEYFLDQCDYLSESALIAQSVNCIDLRYNFFKATNTDFWAFGEELKSFSSDTFKVALLGFGPMAKIAAYWLKEQSFDYLNLIRSQHGDLSFYNLPKLENKTWLIINACSRSFVFQGEAPVESHFWDFNYRHQAHEENLPKRFAQYKNGLSLLYSQANYCLDFCQLN